MNRARSKEEKLAYILNDEELSPNDLVWIGSKLYGHGVSRAFAEKFAPESDMLFGSNVEDRNSTTKSDAAARFADILNSTMFAGARVPRSTKLGVDDDLQHDLRFDAQSTGDGNKAP